MLDFLRNSMSEPPDLVFVMDFVQTSNRCLCTCMYVCIYSRIADVTCGCLFGLSLHNERPILDYEPKPHFAGKSCIV